MLTHVADEVEEEVILHPVVVVEDFGTVDGVVEIEEALQLMPDALDVMLYFFDREEFALLGLERGVANHAGSTADNGERLVACHLEMLEEHDGDEVSDMQRVGGGVDAHIGRSHFFVELFFGAGHNVVNHAAPVKLLNEVGVHLYNI